MFTQESLKWIKIQSIQTVEKAEFKSIAKDKKPHRGYKLYNKIY